MRRRAPARAHANSHRSYRPGGSEVHTVVLRDGASVVVRSVSPRDQALLAGLVKTLSDETAYRRFLGPKRRLTRAELRYFTHVDHRDHDALLALDPRTGAAVGVARYIRDPSQADAAEVAVLVADHWQARGLGTALSGCLVKRARANGVRRFRALTLADNGPALRLVERLGAVSLVRDGRNVEVDVRLASTPPG